MHPADAGIITRRPRLPATAAVAALLSVFPAALPAGAQTVVAGQTTVPPGARLPRARPPVDPNAPKPVRNLGDVLEKVDWNPQERGALLIVAPEKATVSRGRRERTPEGYPFYTSPPPLKEPGAEGYRLTVIDSHFQRKLTQVGSLWAVVPETMTVLNTTRLPEPDPYTGMTNEQKMRLFQSRLSPAEWKRIASPQGLGASDLSREQRELFLSALPDPFAVQVTGTGEDGRPRSERRVLTPAQRSGVRIAMHRKLSWSFAYETEKDGSVSIGVGAQPRSDGKPTLTLSNAGEDWEERRKKMFDVTLTEEQPNHLKPGDVNFESSLLDALISLDGDALTVGELVRRASRASRVELIADLRYVSLPVHARSGGGGVRAGDVLKALCLSVTGTFRKVEDGKGGFAYVMVDDREGLAVRYARLARWARKAGALAESREKGVNDRLKTAKPIEQLSWSSDDPAAPGDALQEKIAAHRKLLEAPRDPKQPYDWNSRFPMIPVADMPQGARELIEKQALSWSGTRFGDGQEQRKLRTDAVRLDVRTATAYIVPGLGVVESSDNFGGGGGNDSLFGSFENTFVRNPATPPKDEFALPVALPGQLAERSLFVRAATPDEAARAAKAAMARGLNRLWLEVPVDAPVADFAAQVAAARQAAPDLSLLAVVRVLRIGTAAARAVADINVVGETTTGVAARRSRELDPKADPNDPQNWAFRTLAAQVKDAGLGDFVNLGVPEGRAFARRRALEIARTPGLSGVVVRDTAAPGYQSADGRGFSDFQGGGFEYELGYTPETRLAFLRKQGVDPVDLAPFGDSNFYMASRYAGGGMPVSLELPFFRDYGPSARNSTYNGVRGIEMGAKDSGEQWTYFRLQQAVDFQNDLFKALGEVTGANGRPLTLLRGSERIPYGASEFAVWDKPLEMPPAPEPGAPAARQQRPAAPGPPVFTGISTVSAESLLAVRPGDTGVPPPADRLALQIGRLGVELNKPTNKNYRPSGLLIDLTSVPTDEGLALLTQLRPPASAPPQAAR